MALVSYSLTTLANLKEVLGETTTDNDDLLTNIINRSTDIIEAYCNGRRFASTAYTDEEYDGTGTQHINLINYPVTALTSYDKNYGQVGDTNWSTLQGELIKRLEDEGQIYYSPGFIIGTRNYRFTYVGGYVTIPNDLEEACIQLCVYTFNNRKSKGMKSESLGEYSYTREDKTGNIIEDLGIDLMLDKYKHPVF